LGEPFVIETEFGPAVEFDGFDDGLIIDYNPLFHADEFTIEVIFKPYSSSLVSNTEQRFIHMQESDDIRILIELRLTEDEHWFLDTFIKDGNSNLALYAEQFPHPVDNWYHAALTYKEGIMSHYVDGVEEMSGAVQYSKMFSGKTSIGVRLNEVSWYKGAIRILKVTHKALDPQDFILSPTALQEENPDRKRGDIFNLFQNYPNPFNPKTFISYEIKKNDNVLLDVYDVLGKKIATLVDTFQQAGVYKVEWEVGSSTIAGKLPAVGIYFAHLQSANMNRTIKLLHLP